MRELTTAGYDEVIASMEYTLVAEANIGSYQGDFLYLLKNEQGKYAYTSLSYGSCSVCDYIEGLVSDHDYNYQDPVVLAELTKWRDTINTDLTWVSARRMLWNLLDGERRYSWYGNSDDYKKFLRATIHALAEEANCMFLKELI